MKSWLWILFPVLSLAQGPSVKEGEMPRVPPTEPGDVQRTLRVKAGFRMELAAAEPLVVDPIALCFDEDGRMFVIEMRDYSERREERLGRVRMLEDVDGDGRMDRSRIFAEGMPWPTALFWYGGGLFVASTPDMYYFRDRDGDGKAEEKRLVFTGFGAGVQRLNVQQLVNSFVWGMDNRIHGASGGNWGTIKCPEHPEYGAVDLRLRDFSFDGGTWRMQRETGGAQHGLSFDNYGRKFVCSNSSHILQVMYEERHVAATPNFNWPSALLDIPVDGGAGPVYRVSPDEPWRVIRTKWRVAGLVPGPIEGGGTPSGYFTGATGALVYRGDALGEDFVGDVFVGDSGSNLIHRKKVKPAGVAFQAERPSDEQKVEFVASTDNWFRPVQFANAPDGALYVMDMYREVIEHPWSLPPGMKEHLDLNSGNDRGRIYRIVRENYKQRARPRLSEAKTVELVELLEHANGWHRETAARLLYERQDGSAEKGLRRIAARPRSKWGRLHALWSLAGMKALQWEDVILALGDKDEGVRENGVRLAEVVFAAEGRMPKRVSEALAVLTGDSEARVRYQLVCSLALLPHERKAELLASVLKNGGDKWERTGALASSSLAPVEVAKEFLLAGGDDLTIFKELATLAGASGRLEEAGRYYELIKGRWEDERAQAMLLSGLGTGLQQQGKALRQVMGEGESKRLGEALARAAGRSLENVSSEEIAVLGMLGEGTEVLKAVLKPNYGSEIQRAAVEALGRDKAVDRAGLAVENWSGLSPTARQRAMEVFSGNPNFLLELLRAIEGGSVQRGELSVTQVAQLKKHGNEAVRGLAIKIFGESAQGSRSEVMKRYEGAVGLKGRVEAGKEIFKERCASCHRVAGQGSAVGPDMETVRMAGRETVLGNIVDPNKEIASRYHAYEVELNDGEMASGIISAETANQLVLRAANQVESTVPRKNIVKLRNTGKSLMPEGLEEGLDAQGMADLLEYVLKGE